MPYTISSTRSYSFLVATCAALVVLADFFFYNHFLGWTTGAFAIVVAIVAAIRNSSGVRRPGMAIPALLLFAVALSIVENITPLNFAMTGVMLVVFVLSLRAGWTSRVTTCVARVFNFLALSLTQLPVDLTAARKWGARHPHATPKIGGVLRAWTIPVLLSLVFVSLFAAANPVISRWFSLLDDVLNNLLSWPEFLSAPRIIFWFIMFIAIWTLLRARIRRSPFFNDVFAPWSPPSLPPDLKSTQPATYELSDLVVYLTPQFIVRCLTLFNLVFLVQTSLDLLYLFGGRALPEGMSYAEYAHRGAYPLVVTALLAAAFVLVTFRPSASTEGMATARKLVYLWIAQNVMLTFAALWRLHLYVDIYTLTRMRVAAGLWMLLVVAGLVSIAWRIVTNRDNVWLTQVNALNAFLLLFLCCFLPIDGFIAMYNVKHSSTVHKGGSRLDLDYLMELGPDSIPALQWLAENTSDTDFAQKLTHKRTEQLETLTAQMSDWRAWTFRRHRLLESDPSDN